MKNISIAVFLLGWCVFVYWIGGGTFTSETKVVQEVKSIAGATLVTRVYYRGEEIEMYFDDLDGYDYTDSIPAKRMKQGYKLIKKIDKVYERKSDYK